MSSANPSPVPVPGQVEDLVGKGNFWFPEAASSYAKDVDLLYYLITYGSVAMFVGLVAFILFFGVRYRRRHLEQKAIAQVTHNTKLEVLWTVIPLILVLIIFYWGFRDYLKMSVAPNNSLEIVVTGQKWSWNFTHPSGANVGNKLVLPVDTDIKFKMISRDVIHAFFIPSFRTKKDVNPNYYTYLYVRPIKEGLYQAFCAEFCGDEHSKMLATVEVVSKDAYEAYLKSLDDLANLPPKAIGERVYKQRCIACHSLDGTRLSGPSWKGVYGTQRELEGGGVVLYDDNYIRESILKPQLKISKGFPPVMPSFSGQLSEKEINGIIEYIKGVDGSSSSE